MAFFVLLQISFKTSTRHIMSDQGSENNHVMFTRIPKSDTEPETNTTTFHTSYKQAHDAGTEIITKNPDAECDIFQIRARLRGKIQVISQEFNIQKTG